EDEIRPFHQIQEKGNRTVYCGKTGKIIKTSSPSESLPEKKGKQHTVLESERKGYNTSAVSTFHSSKSDQVSGTQSKSKRSKRKGKDKDNTVSLPETSVLLSQSQPDSETQDIFPRSLSSSSSSSSPSSDVTTGEQDESRTLTIYEKRQRSSDRRKEEKRQKAEERRQKLKREEEARKLKREEEERKRALEFAMNMEKEKRQARFQEELKKKELREKEWTKIEERWIDYEKRRHDEIKELKNYRYYIEKVRELLFSDILQAEALKATKSMGGACQLKVKGVVTKSKEEKREEEARKLKREEEERKRALEFAMNMEKEKRQARFQEELKKKELREKEWTKIEERWIDYEKRRHDEIKELKNYRYYIEKVRELLFSDILQAEALKATKSMGGACQLKVKGVVTKSKEEEEEEESKESKESKESNPKEEKDVSGSVEGIENGKLEVYQWIRPIIQKLLSVQSVHMKERELLMSQQQHVITSLRDQVAQQKQMIALLEKEVAEHSKGLEMRKKQLFLIHSNLKEAGKRRFSSGTW
ncbi:hypothetical protein ADUPG1_000587, partial [Aduncisulcus paluster]